MPQVVLADDSPTIKKVVELSFAGEDFFFTSFSNGQAALDYMRSHPVDVLLADVSLPGINGYQLCRELKSDDATAHIPVVLLTKTFEPFDIRLAREAGYATHLSKPFETSELVGLVRRLIESSDGRFKPQTTKKETRTVNQKGLFNLTAKQCRPAPTLVTSEAFAGFEPIEGQPTGGALASRAVSRQMGLGSNALGPQEIDLVVAKVMERLPGELRRLLSEALRGLAKPQ